MPITILSGIFPDKEMTRGRRSSERYSEGYAAWNVTLPLFLNRTNYRHYYTVADARPKCALFRRPERTLLLAVEREGGEGEERAGGRGGETGRVMYYRTEIDYWKRYQSYKHSLPLILQSCDVEPSHRRPSLLIPPPAISPPPRPPRPLPTSFSICLFLSFSSPHPFLLAFPICPPSCPANPSPSSYFSHSLRRYVMECTGCPVSTGCPFRSPILWPICDFFSTVISNEKPFPVRDSINFRHLECREHPSRVLNFYRSSMDPRR